MKCLFNYRKRIILLLSLRTKTSSHIIFSIIFRKPIIFELQACIASSALVHQDFIEMSTIEVLPSDVLNLLLSLVSLPGRVCSSLVNKHWHKLSKLLLSTHKEKLALPFRCHVLLRLFEKGSSVKMLEYFRDNFGYEIFPAKVSHEYLEAEYRRAIS